VTDEKHVRTPEEITAAVAEKQALARKANAEAAKAEAEAIREQIDATRKQHEELKRLAGDEHHYVYRFNEGVSSASVNKCMEQLSCWHRTAGDEPMPITLIFNSPGGSVIAGMALFDYLQELRGAGHHVTIVGQGIAASMAGILLQAGDHRVLTAESWLLIHEGSYGATGSVAEVEDTVKWVEMIGERILNIFAARSQASGCKSPLTKRQIQNRYRRKDWWLSSDDALKHGFIDEIASSLTIVDRAARDE
jgi:ATP-dependent Clp protease protease subunit